MEKEKQFSLNTVMLKGEVVSKLVKNHEVHSEVFYEFLLKVPRLSQQFDTLPITVSERLLTDIDIKEGSTVALEGHFRSFNKIVDEKSRLMLTVFVKDFISDHTKVHNSNLITLSGYICKPPIFRTTPFSREICDLLIAVNRAYGKSDYIPCIAWGRNARFMRGFNVGAQIQIEGRIQSREYIKKNPGDADGVTKTAYEVSINKISLIDAEAPPVCETAATEG